MFPKTLFLFILLAQLTRVCRSNVEFWEDFEIYVKGGSITSVLEQKMKDAGVRHSLQFPPYMCYKFREQVLPSLNDFAESFQDILKGKSVSRWFVDLFTNGSEDKLFYNYLNAVDRALVFFKPTNRVIGVEEIEENLKPKGGSSSPHRIIDKVIDRASPALVNPNGLLRERYNYKQIGEFYGRLLYDKKFACFQVPELSLVIFKLFYFRIFETTYLSEFFDGFFGALKDVEDDEPLSKMLSTDSTSTFFGYNLLVLLGISSNLANDLLDIFPEDESRRPALIDNFKMLYLTVLKSIEDAEHDERKKRDDFVKDLLMFKEHAVKKFGKKAAFFTVKYIQCLATGAVLGPLGPVGGFAFGQIFSTELQEINKAIKDFVDPEDKSGDVASVIFEPLGTSLELSHLQNFLGYYESQVSNHKECAFCHLKLREKRREIKKLGTVPSPIKI